jgi:hypothetical protein
MRRRVLRSASAGIAFAVLAGCTSDRPPRGRSGDLFEDAAAAAGIDFRLERGAAGARHVVETMLGGLGWLDYDGDGDVDLFVANGHADSLHADRPGEVGDRLYRNDRGRFVDVTAAAGVGDKRYGNGAAAADFDNDGDCDLLVTNFGRNTLYENRGGVFSDVTEAAGLVEEGYNMSAAWFDFDRDGDLDLYVVRYLVYHPERSRRCREGGLQVYCHPSLFAGEPDLFYRNLGGGRFEEVGARAGIQKGGLNEDKGLGVVILDCDRDGLPDVYVANDTTPNFLWRNNGDGTFTDIGHASGSALGSSGRAYAGMGVDAADVDLDGWLDIFVTNFSREPNSLYVGAGKGLFVESQAQRGLEAGFQTLGFGTQFIDLDLDADPDIVVANGHVNDLVETTDPGMGASYRQTAGLFLNQGDGRFVSAPERGGAFFQSACVARGLAAADYDGDGDPDLAVVTYDRGLVLLENQNPDGNRALVLRLIGRRSPRDPFGAEIEAECGGRRQRFVYGGARSYLASADPRVFIGLGKAEKLDLLRIHWPSGRVQELRDLRPSLKPLVIEEPEGP